MRDAFPGYYKPTQDELADLWSNALIVLDTNALFNLFRYTNATREAFFKVLAAKRDRLWLPYQVGLEFQRGRLGVIEDQQQAFTNLIDKTKTALAMVTNDVGALRNHPSLDLNELRRTVDEAIKTIERKIEATREQYQAEVLAALRHDETTDMITDLYIGKVGSPYDEVKMAEIVRAGAERYEAKIPPGYKDKGKPEPERYGDLVLWFQILDRAESDHSSVIFVGDDQKEDWWRSFKGRKIGPRVELVDEFQSRTGSRIYFLTPHGLMELAKEYDDATIGKDAVQEVAQVSEAQARLAAGANRAQAGRARPDDEEFASMTTDELQLALRRLEFARGGEEKSLRRKLSVLSDIESQGLENSAEYASAQSDVSRSRQRIANFSREIKSARFELHHRTAHEVTREYEWKDPTKREIELARLLLTHDEIPVLGDEADWADVSDPLMTMLLIRAQSGGLPAAMARSLRPLGGRYDSTGDVADASELPADSAGWPRTSAHG